MLIIRCNPCSVYLYVMLYQVALRCLDLRISVPSLTLCFSVHLTIKYLYVTYAAVCYEQNVLLCSYSWLRMFYSCCCMAYGRSNGVVKAIALSDV